jgi:hypothetical protein
MSRDHTRESPCCCIYDEKEEEQGLKTNIYRPGVWTGGGEEQEKVEGVEET